MTIRQYQPFFKKKKDNITSMVNQSQIEPAATMRWEYAMPPHEVHAHGTYSILEYINTRPCSFFLKKKFVLRVKTFSSILSSI
jgi:hypothetical protein